MIFLQLLWLLAPAGLANIGASLSGKWWPKWNWPVDGYLMFRGKRVLGDHKTVRGIICGTLTGFLFFLLQRLVRNTFLGSWELVDYSKLPFYTGFLLGLGGLIGDSTKSFFKRQIGVEPGKSFFPWDQIDWILGTALVWKIMADISWKQTTLLVLMGFVLHMIFKVSGYWLKLDDKLI